MRPNGVVPFWKYLVALNADGLPLIVGHLDPGRIGAAIEIGAASESSLGGGSPDVLEDRLIADQGLSLPVLGDQTEHSMLDQVPFGRTWREMIHGDHQSELIGEFLECELPAPPAAIIGASAVSLNQETAGLGIAASTLDDPPTAECRLGELGRVMGCADHHVAAVVTHVVDSVRNGAALSPAGIVVIEHPSSGFSPCPAWVFEISYPLFLLRIHADYWEISTQIPATTSDQIPELLIPIWISNTRFLFLIRV